MNPAYGLAKRFHDLVDFANFGNYGPDRSGRISGNFLQEIDYNDIAGNRTQSFLREHTEYLSEMRLNLQEKLWKDYNLEGQMFLRKTDNPNIELRKDVRVKKYDVKILNADNLFEAGNFYAEFSPFSLGTNLEGIGAEFVPDNPMFKGKVVAGRSIEDDPSKSRLQRNVQGGKLDFSPFQKSNLFSEFRIGAQVVTSNDDRKSLDYNYNVTELHNVVASIDGDIALKKFVSLNFEAARSAYLANANVSKDYLYGNALRLQPRFDFDALQVRYLFYYVEPRFYTDAGSAAWDKLQHQLNVDYTLNSKISMSATENYYWDHLLDSNRTFRTTNNEKNFSFNIKPFTSRRDFTFRPYANYLKTDSNDAASSVMSRTGTFGFTLNDSFGPSVNYGLRYEYKNYINRSDNSQNEYTNRAGFNISREQKLFGRRLYYSFEPGMEVRRNKSNKGKPDTNITYSCNGQYNWTDKLLSNVGYNVQTTDQSLAGSDAFTTSSFFEFDFLVAPKRSTHFILRFEENRNVYEDGSKSYKETRVISKLSTDF